MTEGIEQKVGHGPHDGELWIEKADGSYTKDLHGIEQSYGDDQIVVPSICEHQPNQGYVDESEQRDPDHETHSNGHVVGFDECGDEKGNPQKDGTQRKEQRTVDQEHLPRQLAPLDESSIEHPKNQSQKDGRKDDHEAPQHLAPVVVFEGDGKGEHVLEYRTLPIATDGAHGSDQDEDRQYHDGDLDVDEQQSTKPRKSHHHAIGDPRDEKERHQTAKNEQIDQKPLASGGLPDIEFGYE